MLAVAGELDPTVGGPSPSLDDAENRRRTVYAAVSRHDLDALLRLFDFPDPNITSDERTVTTVPLQQLVRAEQRVRGAPGAKALAARLTADAAEPTTPAAIRRAYRARSTAAPPTRARGAARRSASSAADADGATPAT